MIRINQVKLNTEHSKEQLHKKIASMLRVSPKDILEVEIIRQSIDARKKPEIFAGNLLKYFPRLILCREKVWMCLRPPV